MKKTKEITEYASFCQFLHLNLVLGAHEFSHRLSDLSSFMTVRFGNDRNILNEIEQNVYGCKSSDTPGADE